MVKVYFYIFFFISFIVLLRLKWRFIFFIPVFNLIADMSFTYFEGLSAPTIIRAAINFLFLIFASENLTTIKGKKYFYAFFSLIAIMLIFSNTFVFSFRVSVQIIMSMSMILVGYSIFIKTDGFEVMLKYLKPIIYISIIATAMGYLFHIGRSLEYTTDRQIKAEVENVGLLGSGLMYAPGIILGLLPLLVKTERRIIQKVILIGSAALLYLLILLNVRRTAIAIPVLGLFGFFIYMPSKLKVTILKYLVFVAIGLVLAYPLYSKILIRRYKIRESRGRFEKDFYKTENRYLEYLQMFSTISKFERPVNILFGNGNSLFVDTNAYGNQSGRMIHSDIPKIFFSLGLVGLFLYFLIYLSILREIASIPPFGELKSIRAACLGLFLISLFVSLNGSITLFSFRALNFLLLGSLLGYAKKMMYSYGELSLDKAG